MADTQPPPFKLGNIYVPQLESTFKISQSEAFDYYSTNSGMYPKNPGSSSGGGGGGGGGDESELYGMVNELSSNVDGMRGAMNKSAGIASKIQDNLNNYTEVDDILSSVVTLKKSAQALNN